jgi:hypothetical protein
MTPLTAPQALDQFFLEARCRLLDLAAILDRIDRGQGAAAANADGRVARIRAGLAALSETGPGRAERVQQIFSQDYDPAWTKPQPRTTA